MKHPSREVHVSELSRSLSLGAEPVEHWLQRLCLHPAQHRDAHGLAILGDALEQLMHKRLGEQRPSHHLLEPHEHLDLVLDTKWQLVQRAPGVERHVAIRR